MKSSDKIIDSLGSTSNIKEAKEYLRTEYGDAVEHFTDNEILIMVDADNMANNIINLGSIKNVDDVTFATKNEMDMAISCITISAVKNSDYSRYVSMVKGDIYHSGRKVIYLGKRYSVFFSNHDSVMITDNNRSFLLLKADVGIMNESLNTKETADLLYDSYKHLKARRGGHTSLCKYIEIFCYTYCLKVSKIMPLLDPECTKQINIELEKYIKKNRLDLDIINIDG